MLLPVALPVMSREVFDEMTVCEVFSKSYFKMLLQHFDVDPHQNRWAGGLRSARTWVADSCHFNADLDPAVKFAPYIWIRIRIKSMHICNPDLINWKNKPKAEDTQYVYPLLFVQVPTSAPVYLVSGKPEDSFIFSGASNSSPHSPNSSQRNEAATSSDVGLCVK
jgi:hypothetical protein